MTLTEALRLIPQGGYRVVFHFHAGELHFQLMSGVDRVLAGVVCSDFDIFVACVVREIAARFDPTYDECAWEPKPVALDGPSTAYQEKPRELVEDADEVDRRWGD